MRLAKIHIWLKLVCWAACRLNAVDNAIYHPIHCYSFLFRSTPNKTAAFVYELIKKNPLFLLHNILIERVFFIIMLNNQVFNICLRWLTTWTPTSNKVDFDGMHKQASKQGKKHFRKKKFNCRFWNDTICTIELLSGCNYNAIYFLFNIFIIAYN